MLGILKDNIRPGAAPISLIDALTREDQQGLTPEELRMIAISELHTKENERFLTDSEKFGSFVEALPGGALEKWVPGTAEAELPSDNIQTILQGARVLKTRLADIESKAETGELTQSQANARIALIDEELDRAEHDIALLIQDSPVMKFNSDGVNFIELKILEIRERSFDAKKAAITGQVRDITDLEIIQGLQPASEEDFTIPGLEE